MLVTDDMNSLIYRITYLGGASSPQAAASEHALQQPGAGETALLTEQQQSMAMGMVLGGLIVALLGLRVRQLGDQRRRKGKGVGLSEYELVEGKGASSSQAP
jgi:hypothetical protein|eukprot:COSAG01_NODE_484_length_16405_cov_4.252790_1_plen_102_part_00